MLPHEFLHHRLQSNLSTRLYKNIHKLKKRFVAPRVQSVDWRKKNVVGKIRDQGNCGACWAFSGIETIESMYATKTGKFHELSVQEVIDCAMFNDGCDGGDTCNMLFWLKMANISVQLERDYPFKSRTNQCTLQAVTAKGIRIDEYSCLKYYVFVYYLTIVRLYFIFSLVGSEDILLDILAEQGPVAVAINAQTWQNYVGGVIEYHCDGNPAEVNHAVQIVGYEMNATIPYYIVRNTWGEDFGNAGYLYLAIGINMCGLANEVSTLTVL